MDAVNKIRLAIHKVLSLDKLLPKNNTTYCNVGLYYILKQLGFANDPNFIFIPTKAPHTANNIYLNLKKNFKNVSIQECIKNILTGNIYVSAKMGKEHGHVAIIYPSKTVVYSNKWGINVPLVANIGYENGIMGLNYAFEDMPDIFYLGKIDDDKA